MKRLFGVVISLIMLVPLFAKDIPLQVTEFESGFEISNLDAKGKRICKGFLGYEENSNVFVILKTKEDNFSMKELAYELLYRPSSLNVLIMDGSSFSRLDKDKKTQLYGPLSKVDSIIIVSLQGKIIDCSSVCDGKNIQISIGNINDEKSKLAEAIDELKALEAAAESEQEKIMAERAERKAEEERLEAEKKAYQDNLLAEAELEKKTGEKETKIKKELDYYLSQKEVYKNDTFAYMLTQDGTIAIVGYMGDGRETLEIPKEIEGISVDRIVFCKSLKKIRFKTVVIPKNIKIIFENAFYNLGIEKIKFEDGSLLQKIGDEAFRYNKLTEMTIPKKDIVIGFDVFSNNYIKKVSIYKDWRFTMRAGFYGKFVGADSCYRQKECAIINSDILEEVVFEEGRDNIPPKAFAGCKNLKKIYIPSTMTDFGTCAFQDCTTLSEIIIAGKPLTSVKDSIGDYKGGSLKDAALMLPGAFEKLKAQNDAQMNPYSAIYIFSNCNLDLKTKKLLIDMGFPTEAF